MSIVHEQLLKLMDEYGEPAVKDAARTFLGGQAPTLAAIPQNYLPIIEGNKLYDTVAQLDASAQDIIDKAKGREEVYGERLSLIRRKRELETAIELSEAEAIMAIRGEARSQYVMVGDERVALSNEESRKAYARVSSKEHREQLAKVEAELFQLEQKAFWAKDSYEAAIKAGDQVQAKANLQAGLLHMLGNRA